LLEQRFAFVPEARLEQHLKPADEAWRGSEAALVLDEGIRFRVGLDANAMRIVASIAQRLPLGEILDEVASQLGVEREAVRAAGADLARRLLELGFHAPATSPA
jgi:hypothetical protein